MKLRKDFSCDQHGKLIHTTRHLVSAVSGDLNLADLGTKRLAKKRLVELMCFCNLGFVENDIFTVIEDMQSIKSIQKISHIGEHHHTTFVDPKRLEPVQCRDAEL